MTINVLPCGCIPHRTRPTERTAMWCDTEQQGYCNFECPHPEGYVEAILWITLWHNISTDAHTRHVGFDGYEPGHALVPVLRVPHTLFGDGSDMTWLNALYTLTNVGEDPTFSKPSIRRDVAEEYRRNRNRSMSVGDVVQFERGTEEGKNPIVAGNDWFACASEGWVDIEAPQFFAIGASTYGSTSLDTDLWRRR